MLTISEYTRLDAQTLSARVAAGKLTPTEIVNCALAQADAINLRYHAFTIIAHEEAIAAARSLETALNAGAPAGPLCGVPVAIKDLILTKGMRTTFGSLLYQDFVPDQDDIVVERLRAAGAIIIGKTNVSEFGFGAVGHNPLFPATRNPWDPTLTPGGSSAGSAVAVTCGVCPVALGSDGGGSVRLPASFNNLFGMKASMGRVPLWPGCRDATMPGVSGWETIEHIGPLTRTVSDAALVLSVISGPDARDRHSIPSADINWSRSARPRPLKLRLAYCADMGGLPLDANVRSVCDAAVQVFAKQLECSIDITAPPYEPDIEMFRAIVASDTDIEGLGELVASSGLAISRGLKAFLQRQWSAREFIESNMKRKSLVNATAQFMHKYDLLLTPTAPCLPFPLGLDGPGKIDGQDVADDAWSPASYPANLTGQPSASLPAGWSETGLPVGLQITGRHLDDATVLKAAASFEAHAPWQSSRPF